MFFLLSLGIKLFKWFLSRSLADDAAALMISTWVYIEGGRVFFISSISEFWIRLWSLWFHNNNIFRAFQHFYDAEFFTLNIQFHRGCTVTHGAREKNKQIFISICWFYFKGEMIQDEGFKGRNLNSNLKGFAIAKSSLQRSFIEIFITFWLK